jgi:cytochrome c oxidase cbb3-type subunit III
MGGQNRFEQRTKNPREFVITVAVVLVTLGLWVSTAHSQTDAKDAAAKRGRAQFAQTCAFCHGPDATGGRGPDLIRSALVAHDQKGELIGEVIRSGRPDKGMPAIPATDDQVADIAAYLHARALEALNSSGVPRDYPAEKLLSGKAEAGQAFFEGAGGCKNCHSPTGDLAGVAAKYSPVELEAHMLYPGDKPKSAVVTLASGEQVRGIVVRDDDFMIGVRGESGWYRSFSRDKVKVEIRDPLEAHRKLLDTLTTAQVHDLFAYVNSLK